jgi:integrase
MQKKLTTKFLDSLQPAKGKREEIRDQLLPGFHVRVSSTGRKVFYLATRVHGRMRRIKIGVYPIVSLADAREKARQILRDVQLGVYEANEAETATTPTLSEVIADFIKLYAKLRNRDWKGTERILKKFAKLNDLPIDQIKRADVVKELDRIVASGTPIRANRALAALKKLMSWCVDRGMIEVSPVAGLKPPSKEVPRERVLTDDELCACWQAAEAEGYPFAQFIQMLMLTGQRRGEVSGMRWSEIDLPNATWTIPAKRAKNATTHTVPLAPLVLDMLKSMPRFLNSDLVFTTNGRTPISGFGRLKQRLDVAVGIDAEDWRFHDIRRTVATNMAMLGVAPHIIEAVLNHRTGIVSGVAAIYNRHAYLDEKREALEQWARYVTGFATEISRVDESNVR